jgi:hypothetical protein
MATYKGKDGSVTFAGGTVAQVEEFTLHTEVDVLDVTHMGDVWERKLPDLGRWNGTVRCSFDYGDTTGQKVMTDKVVGATPGGTAATIELVIATGKKFTGSAFITSLDVTHATRAVAKATFNFVGDGALTVAWA